MTTDEVIALAREAGWDEHHCLYDTRIERFAALVAAHEREECAKVCDDWPNGRDDVDSIAAAIRSRT